MLESARAHLRHYERLDLVRQADLQSYRDWVLLAVPEEEDS